MKNIQYFVSVDFAYIGKKRKTIYRVMSTSGVWVATVLKHRDVEAFMAQFMAQ